MTLPPASDRTANMRGTLWMIAAMAAFALEDALIKSASAALPIGQVLALFGMGGALCFALAARLTGQSLCPPEVLSRPMLIRSLFEILGRLFYVLAIALIPLSTATVILQATPLVVVAAAAVLFGETVGPRRWIAVLLGLLGVVIILQPGLSGFSPLSLLAVLGMLGFAGRDLASRAAPASLGTALLGLYGFLAIVLAGLGVAMWEKDVWVMAGPEVTLSLLGAIVAGVLAYSALMKAMRTGEVSAVTPFRYTRLLFGIGLGMLFFGERLTPPMLLGGGLIVLSGLFILWRRRGHL